MSKILSALVLSWLAQLPILAWAQEREVANAPVETVSMVYVIAFGVVFLGMIAGFFFFLFWNDRQEKPQQK
jgi:hypothetical protein